jgi:hypothetical protein
MKTLFIFILILLVYIPGKITDLDELKWKNRVVLYFVDANRFDKAHFGTLEKEFADRKLIYFIISENVQSNIPFNFSSDYLKKLRKDYFLGRHPQWVLIGLDGGVKARKESDLDWEEVFGLIDAMPMRQSEIRRKNN